MPMSMSPAFTTADRRKRIATYGKKPARTSTIFDWNADDAPSPERPRKLYDTRHKPAGALGAGPTVEKSANPRTRPVEKSATRDVFDVPSDEEMVHPPSPRTKKQTQKPTLKPIRKPAPKQAPKQAVSIDDFDVPSSGDEVALPKRRLGTLDPVRSISKPSSAEITSLSASFAPLVRRTKPSQTLHKPANSEQGHAQALKRSAGMPEVVPRATDSVPSLTHAHKRIKSAPGLPSKKRIVKPAPELDTFDIPSPEENVSVRTPKRLRPAPLPRAKTPKVSRTGSGLKPPGENAESDDSNASKKRKRQVFNSSTTDHKKAETVAKTWEPHVSQRNERHQRNEDCMSLEQGPGAQAQMLRDSVSKEPTVNKPKRTRLRTLPASARATIAKGQSSPAKLHGMLAVGAMSKPAIVAETPEALIEDDTTLYDISDLTTSLVPLVKAPTTGSVTPRQNAIFNDLLGDSSSTTPGMPSISRLRLTERRPKSLVAGLARSSSDIPQTIYSRKPRLIDTLTQAASSSEEEDNESDEESEAGMTECLAIPAPTVNPHGGKDTVSVTTGPVDVVVDSEKPSNSQASQSALLLNNSTKVTYAKQRSYIEETSLEDGLLLSMDFDDLPGFGGFGSNKRPKSFCDDEDDPQSQVRGIHELRKQGQNQKFQMEAQSAIDEISGRAGVGASLRRSAMLEFCLKMADERFIEQLLNSALGHQFLACTASQGEMIFDFAAATAITFILTTEPGYTVLDQIHRSDIMETLTKLLDSSLDISRIAKDRKTNLSKISQESVTGLRTLVYDSPIWAQEKPDKVSPQILAMKTLELLVLALRKAGSTEALLHEGVINKLLDIVSAPCNRLQVGKEVPQDTLMLNLSFSIMEAVSVSKERQAMWSSDVVRRLVEVMPVFFEASGASAMKMAIRLCMNLTNNKPKACDAFAGPSFVQALVRSIGHKFTLLASEVEEQRTELREGLILSLGAMINLAEFSDKARASVVMGDDELVDVLVTIFLEGSERAAQADSMEESQSSVTVGYLALLLGNLCLNDLVRYKVRSRLPGQKMDMLVESVREFVRYNEKVDRETSQFQGDEGRETWRMFTMRLLLVVERLEKAEA